MFLPSLGSRRHSAISKCFIRSTEISFVAMAEEGWNTVQEFFDGSGNKALNMVSSLSCDAHFHAGLLPQERDGTSVI